MNVPKNGFILYCFIKIVTFRFRSPLALSCLVQIASVRRSLFNNAERGKFLNQLVSNTGVKLGVSKYRSRQMQSNPVKLTFMQTPYFIFRSPVYEKSFKIQPG